MSLVSFCQNLKGLGMSVRSVKEKLIAAREIYNVF